YATKLMYTRIGTDVRAIRKLDMARESCSVRHNHTVTQEAIMSYVGLRHNQTIIPDAGEHPTAFGPAMNGDELANPIPLATLCPGGLAFVFQILRSEANRDEREYVCSFADISVAIDHAVGFESYSRRQLNMLADDAVRPDVAVAADLCAFTD